jgi:hypothetical protein
VALEHLAVLVGFDVVDIPLEFLDRVRELSSSLPQALEGIGPFL